MPTSNSNQNILRNRVIDDLKAHCLPNVYLKRVAVVGGSLEDPEVAIIEKHFPNVTFEVFGIENSQQFMDLNKSEIPRKKFDLVLCTNVIEHVYHHENFAKNLLSLINQRGLIWCAFPFSDMFHGSPRYYSAGFAPEYVAELFSRNGGHCQVKRVISSKRLYLFTHFLRDWPSEFRYNHPFIGQILWGLGKRGNSRPPIRNLSLYKLVICLFLCVIQKDFTADENYGCGAWVKISKMKGS
jgi:hypothetical protein